MKKNDFITLCYALGLAVVLWVATTSVTTHPLVLAMTLVIGAVFTLGMLELRRYRKETLELAGHLGSGLVSNTDPEQWLMGLPDEVQMAVRHQIEGIRVPFALPAFTPYGVGLLVMLGMLGTFLGMVVTLSGTAFALQNLTDVQGIRDAFSEPIKGLGLAFGASVAGVATSALLGLMLTLSKRERHQVWAQLQHQVATLFQPVSPAHHRAQTLALLQQQVQMLPQWVDMLGQWTAKAENMHIQLNDQLLARHEEHARETRLAQQELTASIETSLRTHLDETISRSAETMVRMARETSADLRAQAETVNERLLAAHHDMLNRQQDQIQRSIVQIDAVVAQHLGQLGASLEAPLARLMDISSQAPKAAAEVIVELRQRINESMARDNQLLQEREEIMSQLAKVSQSFTLQVQTQGGQLTELAAQLQASATEVGALAQSFATAAQSLILSQQSTLDHLRQIEAALSQSMSRSDDQMNYYLKQAKEVIELSLSAQKPLLEALERIGNHASVDGGQHAQ